MAGGMRPFSESELTGLFDFLQKLGGDALMYLCLAATLTAIGGRITEVLELRRRDFLDKDGKLRTEIKRLKLKTRSKEKNKYITVALQVDIFGRWIMPWLEYQSREYKKISPDDFVFAHKWKYKHIHRQTVWRRFTAIYEILDIGGGHGLHGFRKTFAVLNLKIWTDEYNGDSLKAARQIQKLLGHSALETTLDYLDIDRDDPNQSIKKAFSFLAA